MRTATLPKPKETGHETRARVRPAQVHGREGGLTREDAATFGCPFKVASVGYTSYADRDCRAYSGPRSGDVK